MPKAIADASTSAPRAPNVIAFQTPQPVEFSPSSRVSPGEVVALSLAMDAPSLACWLNLGRIFAAKGRA